MSKYIHKVNYYETDKMGITHHSNYIRFMEEARMNALAQMGYPMTRLEAEGITSPVVSVNCEYKRTTTYDDNIEIEVTLVKYTGVKLYISYVMKNAVNGEVVALASSSHCFINKNGTPIAVKKHFPDFDAILKREVEHQRGESILGDRIDGVTNKKYGVSDEDDMVSVQGIKPFLSEKSQHYANKIKVYKSLESTNKTAKEMAAAGAEHGTVIISGCQTMGRGRHTRKFFSPYGGLYMSIVLRPEVLRFDNPTSVTAFAAVSVCEAIESISEKTPEIKWVNDIYIDGKKVCGILTETVTDFESGGLDWIVLGIGINVCTGTEDFPQELKPIATSIYPDKKMLGIINKLSAEIINRILGLEASPSETEIFEKYKKRLIMLGKEITIIQNHNEYKATAIDVDSVGRLVVKNENGETTTLTSGEIRIENPIH